MISGLQLCLKRFVEFGFLCGKILKKFGCIIFV
jgi:hypothetical protein